MLKKFIEKVLMVVNNSKQESLWKQGSTMAKERTYVDSKGNLFKGKYLGKLILDNVVKFKYELNGGIYLLDSLAMLYRGVSTTAITYSNKDQVQILNKKNGLLAK